MTLSPKFFASLIGIIGFLSLVIFPYLLTDYSTVGFIFSFLAMTLGGLLFFQLIYGKSLPGIKNNGVWFNALTSKGIWGWLLGIILTLFYVAIYWFPEVLGYQTDNNNSGLVAFFDPLSLVLNGKPATQWFLYGTLYTFAILLFGIKFIWKYRHNRYQIIRTLRLYFFSFALPF